MVNKALMIAASICVYTNSSLTIETLDLADTVGTPASMSGTNAIGAGTTDPQKQIVSELDRHIIGQDDANVL